MGHHRHRPQACGPAVSAMGERRGLRTAAQQQFAGGACRGLKTKTNQNLQGGKTKAHTPGSGDCVERLAQFPFLGMEERSPNRWQHRL
jgi:hypothetical protein